MRKNLSLPRELLRRRSGFGRLARCIVPKGVAVLTLLAALWGCSDPSSSPLREAPKNSVPEGAPKLVLLLVADQMEADHLARFEPLFTGGFRRLLDQGVSFTQAYHGHAATLTAPGHASLATGVHPRRHGIVGNWWYDPRRGEEIYAVHDDEVESSPRQLMTSALGDWIKQAWPQSKVFGASGKDRAAVLLAGRLGDRAYWYESDTANWVSSDYYGGSVPEWVERFNNRRLMDAHFGASWEPLPVPAEILEEIGVTSLDLGPLEERFPHVFGSFGLAPSEGFYGDLRYSPWQDRYLGQFAEELIVAEELGTDAYPDLLALSFSSLDRIGHEYGPDSREALDVLLRLDQDLERLFNFVDRWVGLEQTWVLLSSDHGAGPVPELQAARGLPGRRATQDDVLCFQRVGERLAETLGEESWFLPGRFINPEALKRSGVAREVVEKEAAQLLEECSGVERVWTRGEIEGGVDPSDPYSEEVANHYYPDRSPDFIIRFEEGFLWVRDVASTHGSPYAYDAHVPMLVLAPGVKPARVDRRVLTVDAAPTLAAALGIELPEHLDGSVLVETLGAVP